MRKRHKAGPAGRPPGPASSGSFALSRRAIVTGGLGAAALIALPDAGARATPAAPATPAAMVGRGRADSTGRGIAEDVAAADTGDATYAFVYGTLSTPPYSGGTMSTTPSPGSSTASATAVGGSARSGATLLSDTVPVAVTLATAPVTSPDQSSTVLATVNAITGGQQITVTLVDKSTLAVSAQNTISLTGIPDGTNILITPVFAPGTTVIALVLALTVPTAAGQMRKRDPVTRKPGSYPVTAYRSEHALAYFDSASGAIEGPFYLGDAGSLALTTVAANGSDLFVMTTEEPRPATSRSPRAPVSVLHAFPHGSGKARFSVPAFGSWPGGEPIVTLANGDIARLVNGRTVQVFSAKDGDLTQHAIAPINVIRAKPSSLTMETRPDGTVFLTKPGIGKAVIADPDRGFATVHEVTYAVPGHPSGTPWSKAVLSADSSTLFAVGDARTGGLAAYDVKSGTLAGVYTKGEQYTGVYVQPSGSLLAVSGPANPRLSFFTPELSPVGTASTDLQVVAIY